MACTLFSIHERSSLVFSDFFSSLLFRPTTLFRNIVTGSLTSKITLHESLQWLFKFWRPNFSAFCIFEHLDSSAENFQNYKFKSFCLRTRTLRTTNPLFFINAIWFASERKKLYLIRDLSLYTGI